MRIVKFIHSLNIQERPYYGEDEINYSNFDRISLIDREPVGGGILTDEVCETKIVPVHKINRRKINSNEVETTYIAYSEEVEKLLDMPFTLLKENAKLNSEYSYQLERELRRYTTATWWTRFRYLFTSKITVDKPSSF